MKWDFQGCSSHKLVSVMVSFDTCRQISMYSLSFTDFVGPDCDIPCMDYQGEFIDPKDGSDYSSPVEPVFECVQQDGSHFTAWFGYVNDNGNNIYISGHGENMMIGTDLGAPPTKFEQGTVTYAFSVRWVCYIIYLDCWNTCYVFFHYQIFLECFVRCLWTF